MFLWCRFDPVELNPSTTYFWPVALPFTLLLHCLYTVYLWTRVTHKCKSTVVTCVWGRVAGSEHLHLCESHLCSPAYIYITRCRKAKNLDYMAKARAPNQINLSQLAIMWLHITQPCFPLWWRVLKKNIPFEGQFKTTRRADGTKQLWIIWIVGIGV